jgi:TolA-binding protein
MRLLRKIVSIAPVFYLCLITTAGFGQLGFSFDIKKPEQYDDRVLPSEKSEAKKFTLTRRFVQNNFTRYNYVFNANNKLNQVLEDAKLVHLDNYNELLSFYNYDLDETAANTEQLDSVIYKASTGIVLHDLRNDWTDNLYLLIGAAYYLRKDFDSAYLTFQFINYAYAPKEKDGYYKNIGSQADGNNAFSVSTKEKNSIPRKVFAEPPSRNDAFIWQIRTLIAREDYAEAASLIVTLKNDPSFPRRLQNDLEEVQALWYYNNNMYDSAAVHLSRALSNATNTKEKVRWEFLVAQLYALGENAAEAKSYYEKVINHTTDPVMEMHARLNSLRINKSGNDAETNKNIEELLKMAKKGKYYDYRDVIYYTIAQMESDRGNLKAVQEYLQKSIQYNSTNISIKNQAWLQLAEMAFNDKKFRIAHNCYDSLDMNDPMLKDKDQITTRKNILGRLATYVETIERQDSLQRIAAMNEDERKAYINKLLKEIRKQQGLKDESIPGLVPIGPTSTAPPVDLFALSKGEWYFYNASLKSKGLAEFKAKWGNRPNVDNWRRSAGMGIPSTTKTVVTSTDVQLKPGNLPPGEITFDALYENLPLTEEKLKISNDSISVALFLLAKGVAEDLEDCDLSIRLFEDLVRRFPQHEKMDEALFMLYYCYNKTGDKAKAERAKKLMSEKYPGNRLTTIITTGKDPKSDLNPDATKAYEQVYDLFIEGKFEKALAEKEAADKKYGTHYWTPQLLYIESVYYIHQRQDEKAKTTLQTIIDRKPGTPMAQKAATMIDVLNRREQIEKELTELKVERPVDESLKKTEPEPIIAKTEPVEDDTPVLKSGVNKTVVQKDSLIAKKNVSTNNAPGANNMAVKPDTKAANEQLTKSQPKEDTVQADLTKQETKQLETKTDTTTVTKTIVENTINETPPKTQPVQPEVKPVLTTPVVTKSADSLVNKPSIGPYTMKPDDKYYTMILLNKVDLVWVNETRNAFSIYNRNNIYNRQFEYSVTEINPENKALLIGVFNNAQDAINYVESVKPISNSLIIPWLKTDKYSFTIISLPNLETLKTQKDLNFYKQFADKNWPGKF